MTRYYCDMCDQEITGDNSCTGGSVSPSRLGTEVAKRGRPTMRVEIMISTGGTANEGMYCRYCVLDALNKLDNRDLHHPGSDMPTTPITVTAPEPAVTPFELLPVLTAPWSEATVDALNAHQRDGRFHPYTCGSGNRTDAKHLDGEGVLVATPDGWVCPWCDYRQDWAGQESVDVMKVGGS